MKSLPHLTFLRSFEAAARHLSFTSAAEELNSTQASVSNHVRSLEDYIGRPLFVRHARSLTLTDVGLGYLPSVQRALQDLDAATRSLVTDHASHAVTVSCPVSLTENWMPRVMAGFHKTHPKIELALNSTVWADLQENASDITITIAHEDDVDPSAQRLWADKLVLLCAPSYPKVSAETLSDERAIHILGRPEYWNAVTKKLGLNSARVPVGFQCNSTIAALELAAAGAGVVVAPKSLALKLLDRQELIEPIVIDCPSPWTYYASFKSNLSPSASLFKDWLLGQAGNLSL